MAEDRFIIRDGSVVPCKAVYDGEDVYVVTAGSRTRAHMLPPTAVYRTNKEAHETLASGMGGRMMWVVRGEFGTGYRYHDDPVSVVRRRAYKDRGGSYYYLEDDGWNRVWSGSRMCRVFETKQAALAAVAEETAYTPEHAAAHRKEIEAARASELARVSAKLNAWSKLRQQMKRAGITPPKARKK